MERIYFLRGQNARNARCSREHCECARRENGGAPQVIFSPGAHLMISMRQESEDRVEEMSYRITKAVVNRGKEWAVCAYSYSVVLMASGFRNSLLFEQNISELLVLIIRTSEVMRHAIR